MRLLFYSLLIMAPILGINRLSTQRSVILHFWKMGYRCAAEMARITKIPVRTIRYNMAKLQVQGTVDHRGGNGRHRKITPDDSVAVGQWIRRNNEITACRTVFFDETCYQLFRNSVRRWSKDAKRELKRIPKNKQKIMVWGAFSIQGQLSCHSFRSIMDGP